MTLFIASTLNINRMTVRNYVPQTKPIANSQPSNNVATNATASTVEPNSVIAQTPVEVPVNQGQQGSTLLR